ncbi:MAG: TolC family protein [Myxococcota bacterium]
MFRLFTSALCIWGVLGSSAATGAPEGITERELTRDDAVAVATKNNLGLMLDAVDREVQSLVARTARRPFVPQLGFNTSYNVDPVIDATSVNYSGRVDWNIPFGTNFNIQAGSAQFLRGQAFIPTPPTSLDFGVTQPLLRDGWGRGNLLEQRDLEVELQRELFLEQLNQFIVQVDLAYWDLAFAQSDVQIKERSLERARRQYEDTAENIRRGLLAPGEIFVPEENLVVFEQQLLTSQQTLTLARSRLARLLRVSPTSELVAVDSLDVLGAAPLELGRQTDAALRKNPRVAAQRVALEQAEIQVVFERNQRAPRLDASGSVGFNALSPRDELGNIIPISAGEAWLQTLSLQNPEYRVGLTFQIPLNFDPLDAQLERAELQQKRQWTRLRDVEDDVRYGMRDLLVQLDTSLDVLELATRRVALVQSRLTNEQDKYRSGLSTLLEVVRAQRAIDDAQLGERRARVNVLQIRARIRSLEGTLYERAGVTVR